MVLDSDILETKMEDFDKLHNVNLRSAVNLSLLALPHLIKTKGNIVNISSALSTIPVILVLALIIDKEMTIRKQLLCRCIDKWRTLFLRLVWIC